MANPVRTRCAIYTRKSSEEGLEQEFNSLDAQREACEAYITSQKHEGWVIVPTMYDDGGISGGTMDRPALKKLLADIEAGRTDVVVVYKVDRLTRSLADFARIVEVFDRAKVSFVSITQQFNTTTSMGRLTLNMLLSFAQFEREVTGERIRDKIAASKRKGMWMGGNPPLGYDVKDRKLVINESETDTVRHIYRRYLDLGCVSKLRDDLQEEGIVSKIRVDKQGNAYGGKPIARGALYLMLQNPIYIGRIRHREDTFPGQHERIIEPELWDQVQQTLQGNRVKRKLGTEAKSPSLLAGFVYDEQGKRLTPTHANKKGTRYRYYVSHNLIRNEATHQGRRIPANDLEWLVENRLTRFLTDEHQVHEAISDIIKAAVDRQSVVDQANMLAVNWKSLAPHRKKAIYQCLIERIDVLPEQIVIKIRATSLSRVLDPDFEAKDTSPTSGPTIQLTIDATLKRVGMEIRLIIPGAGSDNQTADKSLLKLMANAHRYRTILFNSGGKAIGDLARDDGVTSSYFTRVLRLSFLSPDIIRAILNGKQPIELSAKELTLKYTIPTDWTEQKQLLGF